MANVLRHRFASAKANGPDATQIQPSHWNDGHAFSGGNAGDFLTRDLSDGTWGAKWTPAYAFLDVPYAASNFAMAGSAWNVTSGNQITFGYILIARMGFLLLKLDATTVSGSPGQPFLVTLPILPVRSTDAIWYGSDNGVTVIVRARVIANDPTLRLYRFDGSNWTVSPANTYLSGQIAFPV